MSQTRTATVTESAEQLQALAQMVDNPSDRSRLAMLQLMRAQPQLSLSDIADRIGRPLPTIKRWWGEYRRDGLGELSDLAARPRRKRDASIDELHGKLLSGEIASMRDIKQWMDAKVIAEAKGRYVVAPVKQVEVSDAKVQFLNTFSQYGDFKDWMKSVHDALLLILPDVNRVTLEVNFACDLHFPETYMPGLKVSSHLSIPKHQKKKLPGRIRKWDNDPVSMMLEDHHNLGFPFEQYQEPSSFTYYYGGTAYLGCVCLWRNRNEPPISEQTLQLVSRLESFIIFLMVNVVLRIRYAKPAIDVFHEAFDTMNIKLRLTESQKKVVCLQFAGFSNNEIATMMHISYHTVRTHIRAVYAKAGVHSFTELISKFLSQQSLKSEE